MPALVEWRNSQPDVITGKARKSIEEERKAEDKKSAYSGPVIQNPKTGKQMRLSDDQKSWVEF